MTAAALLQGSAGTGTDVLTSYVPILMMLVAALGLAAVLLSGLLWTWLATTAALKGPLMSALRNE